MASVPLEFALPAEEGLTAIKIYESATPDGPWTMIEQVTAIGTYPEYIHEYETANAVSATDWFAITVVDQANVESDLSVPMRGGTNTLVNILTDRVKQRAATFSESIIIQEAEAVIEDYFGEDPYLVDPNTVTYRVRAGLTYLILARVAMAEIAVGGQAVSWTAGLVSMKSQDILQSKVSLEWLTSEAQKLLGLGLSRIAQMITPEIAGGLSMITNLDISRLQVTSIE